VPKVPLVKV